MWDRLLTLIRCWDADVANGDRGAWLEDSGVDRDMAEGTVGGWAAALGVELVPAGVGCSECGRKRGLGGGCRLAPVLASDGVDCEGCAGVELDAGATESAMGTSADGATIRGDGFALACVEGRTGVWCTAGDSCVCWWPPPNMGF
jgi:hypothetical protein